MLCGTFPVMKRCFCLIVLWHWCLITLADVANDEDSLKMPAYKVARAGHYPMVYDRLTGIPWPCDPFGEPPKEKDAEKDPSFIKLSKCPEEKKGKVVKRRKRHLKHQQTFLWRTWKRSL